MKKCPYNFKTIPNMPDVGIHPCSGCQACFFDEVGKLTCIVIYKSNKELTMPKKISKKRLEKIEKLADAIIDSWDLDLLVEYAKEHMVKSLSSLNGKEFCKEWKDNYYGIDET